MNQRPRGDTTAYPITIWKKQDGYAEALLSEQLYAIGYRLQGDYANGEILCESDGEWGIGKTATRLVFMYRSDGTRIRNAGIPFLGDVVRFEMDGLSSRDYTFEDVEEWFAMVMARIEQGPNDQA